MAARGTYVPGTDDVARPTALKGLMEINHPLLSWASDLLREEENRTVESRVLQLRELAKHYACGDELNCAMSHALESA